VALASAISLRNVTLDFPVLDARSRSLKRDIAGIVGGRRRIDRGQVVVRAIDDVSFDLSPGDRLGLVGPNGSGKTTLLRLIAGVYEPSSGSVEVQGSVASFLDLMAGFDIEATGRENVVLRSTLLNRPRADIMRVLSYVEDISELGSFFDMPVRTYSSGMLMRLAFGLATANSADILLMDEWLSVGDEDYIAKSDAIVRGMIAESGILVMASHSQQLLEQWCNRIISLDHGAVARITESR
jgi:lipopolysaccharide transport system ATP-binding protein